MKVGDGTVPSEQASVYIVAFLVGAFLKVAGVLGTQKPLIWQSAVLSGLSSQENSSGPHPKMHVPSLKKSRLCPRLLPADPLSTHSCMCLRLHRTARRLTVNPKPADAPPPAPPHHQALWPASAVRSRPSQPSLAPCHSLEQNLNVGMRKAQRGGVDD